MRGEYLKFASLAEDVASVTDGLPASVAEVGNVPAVGASVENDGGALLRISLAFCGLVECLVTSVEEFEDVEYALEVELAAGSSENPQTSVSVEEARPGFLRGVAGTLQQTVGASVLDFTANAEVQELMPAIQKASLAKHHAFFQELMNVVKHQQPNPCNVIAPREVTLGYISNEDWRITANRAARSTSTPEFAIDVSSGGISRKEEVFSFKLRGAYNMMAKLPPQQLKKGVICSSAGNHAQGVALAARKFNCDAVIAMPVTTPEMKEVLEALGESSSRDHRNSRTSAAAKPTKTP